jgi:hypothetical protein
VLSRASSANKSVLRTLEPLDFGVLERGPIGFAVAETAHVTFRDLLKRHAHKFRRPEVPCDVHLALSDRAKTELAIPAHPTSVDHLVNEHHNYLDLD